MAAPGPISCHLPGLRVETRGKRVLTGQHSTVALQVIFGDSTPIHPLAQTLVADKLDNANRLINGLILLLLPVQFVFVDQHGSSCSLQVLLEDTSFCTGGKRK